MKQAGVRLLLILLSWAGIISTAQGQAQMQHPVHPAYLKSYLTDTRDLVVAPFRAPASAWKKAGLAGMAIGGSMLLDRSVNNGLGTPAQPDLSLDVAAAMGNGNITLPATGLMWGIGYLGGDEQLAATGLLAAKAFILSRLLVQLPKYAFQRHRPLEAAGEPFLFAGPLGGFRHDAFPSGHVTSAFATAAVMRAAFQEEHRWVPVLFYGMGVATAAGRLAEGKHWFSDVVAGALFGHAVGCFLATRSNSKLQAAAGGLVYRF